MGACHMIFYTKALPRQYGPSAAWPVVRRLIHFASLLQRWLLIIEGAASSAAACFAWYFLYVSLIDPE